MIYFDAGATTLQKPEAVARAMYRAVGTLSSPGRGSYPDTRAAEETEDETLAAVFRALADDETRRADRLFQLLEQSLA